MPFAVSTIMEHRQTFVLRARQEGATIGARCRQFGISPKTAYRWIDRYRAAGADGLVDRSHRPQTSPAQTAPAMEAQVLAVRTAHPTWGGRKIHAWLRDRAGVPAPPVPSTITELLRRHGQLTGPRVGQPRAYGRFERAVPNELWQLDFMGHRAMARGRVHPLSVLDDHSRFGLALVACAHERADLVQTHLIAGFQRYGLPEALLADNGAAWGSSQVGALTWLEAWFMRLGIRIRHGRPRHPQTQGKVERWPATIAPDVFPFGQFLDLVATQAACDGFRHTYNTDRPHDALGLHVPAERYQPSPRPDPAVLPAIASSADPTVHRVNRAGRITIDGPPILISEALRGLPVGVRPTGTDEVVVGRFGNQAIKRLDRRVTA